MKPTEVVALAAPLLFAAGRAVPKFEPDPGWPKPLPNHWMLGPVPGIFVDAQDHIWVTNRPGSLEGHDKYAADGKAAVQEFDAAGSLIRGWGGPGPGCAWPDDEHGKFLLQIGHHGNSGGSNDTEKPVPPGGHGGLSENQRGLRG